MKEGILPPVRELRNFADTIGAHHDLETPNGRILTVSFKTGKFSLEATTFIHCFNERNREPGSTTALYEKARGLMQEQADTQRGYQVYVSDIF